MKPYEPNCTILGHDTSTVADPRSIESLVDFRKSNLWWLKKFGDDVHGRIHKFQLEAQQAEKGRLKALEEQGFTLEPSPSDRGKRNTPAEDEDDLDELEMPIDPSLMGESLLGMA